MIDHRNREVAQGAGVAGFGETANQGETGSLCSSRLLGGSRYRLRRVQGAKILRQLVFVRPGFRAEYCVRLLHGKGADRRAAFLIHHYYRKVAILRNRSCGTEGTGRNHLEACCGKSPLSEFQAGDVETDRKDWAIVLGAGEQGGTPVYVQSESLIAHL